MLFLEGSRFGLHRRNKKDVVRVQIVTLFNSTKSNISEHIKHIYTDKELEKESTVRFFRTVQQEGKRTSLPPLEGIFQNGQIFDAYNFACVIQMLYFCK